MIKPTKAQLIDHLREGIHDTCLVCGAHPVRGSWTDMNGEINCSECGMTYQIISFKGSDELLSEFGITRDEVAGKHCPDFERVPIYQAYWQKTHNRLPLGSFMGSPPQWKRDAQKPFVTWLWNHRDTYQTEYAEFYNWDVVQEIAEDDATGGS